MRKRALLIGVLVLVLAACGGNDGNNDNESPAGNDSVQATPSPDATEPVSDSVEISQYEPGVYTQSGLTVLRHKVFSQDEVTYVIGEVRNDTSQMLAIGAAYVIPLDANGFTLGPAVSASSLLTNIPPGQVYYVAANFPTPADFGETAIWVQNEPADMMPLTGYFELPATIESQGMAEGIYTIRGTVQNTSDQPLYFPVIDVVLIGPDDDLVGFSHGRLTTADPGAAWPAGESVPFEAQFVGLAVPPEQVTNVRVLAVGYALVE